VLLKLSDMVLLLAFFDEFGSFLKIFLWIALPLIIVSLLVTTIFHYSQKKKNALRGEEHSELPVHGTVDISLVSRLQKEVFHYKRRIKELQHALTFAKEVIPPESLKTRINSLHDEVSALKTNPVPQDDYLSVTDNTTIVGSGGFDGAAMSESTSLTGNPASADSDSPTSAAYLHDLVNEQKTHVLFLQQQLETRIKSFHDLEFQFRENAALLEKMTMSYEHLKHQLDDGEGGRSAGGLEGGHGRGAGRQRQRGHGDVRGLQREDDVVGGLLHGAGQEGPFRRGGREGRHQRDVHPAQGEVSRW